MVTDAANHENHLIGALCHILVHPSLKVGKAALHGIVAHTAAANLVGHEDKCGILVNEFVKFGLDGRQCIVNRRLLHVFDMAVEEKVGTPQRDAVNHNHAACHMMPAQVFLFFDVGPLWSASFTVPLHSLAELFVPDMGSSQIYWIC